MLSICGKEASLVDTIVKLKLEIDFGDGGVLGGVGFEYTNYAPSTLE